MAIEGNKRGANDVIHAKTASGILKWSPKYTVRIAQIDREHEGWFLLINQLHGAMLAGEGTRVVNALVGEITQYTAVHLAHEEAIMLESRYPDARQHIESHNEFRQRVASFEDRLMRGETTLTIELTLFMAEWIKQHIRTVDRRLGDYLRQSDGFKDGAMESGRGGTQL